jgi:hypothetical protein
MQQRGNVAQKRTQAAARLVTAVHHQLTPIAHHEWH